MKLVIIESPYADGRDPRRLARNMVYLRRALRDSLLRGESPIASHAIYPQEGVLDDHVPEERKLGIEAGLAWGRRADLVAVYDDLGITPGMQHGVLCALAEGRKVVQRHLGGNWDVLAEGERVRVRCCSLGSQCSTGQAGVIVAESNEGQRRYLVRFEGARIRETWFREDELELRA